MQRSSARPQLVRCLRPGQGVLHIPHNLFVALTTSATWMHHTAVDLRFPRQAASCPQVLAVKAALRACREAHDQLPLCREREIARLQPLLRQGLQAGHGGFIYVAGTPGIGEHPSDGAMLRH